MIPILNKYLNTHLQDMPSQKDFDLVQSQRNRTYDSIQLGKDSSNAFSKIIEKIKGFCNWIYVNVRLLFSKIFYCFDCLKLEAAILEKHQKNLKTLETYSLAFSERRNRQEEQEFKNWWKKAFQSFDPDVRRMLILEDVKTYAKESHPDRATWANENYEKYCVLSTKFVQDLEKQSYDPKDYIPGYIENVKDQLREKIQTSSQKGS